jgi:cytochrome P450
MLDFLLTDDVRRDPYPLYAQLRESAPVLEVPGTDLWALLDYEGVKRALSDHETFSSTMVTPIGASPDWVLFVDPPRHNKLRGTILRAFTPRSIANLEPRIRELSRKALDRTVDRGEMDVVTDYAEELPTMVIADMLGIPIEDKPLFLRWSRTIMALSHNVVGGTDLRRVFDEADAVKEEMRAYLSVELERRRRAPADDLLTRLIEAEVDGDRLTEEEILGFFQLLIAAGTETTTLTISCTILCLLENPAALARLQAAPHLLPSVIEEVLRYRSPSQVQLRQTKRDVEVHGRTIPAGKLVLMMLGSANRDPKQFRDADRFDIERDPNPHLGLGHGIHFCLGAALTRMEARIAVSHILERAQGIELRGPWTPCKGFLGHGPMSLPIRFEPSRCSPTASP